MIQLNNMHFNVFALALSSLCVPALCSENGSIDNKKPKKPEISLLGALAAPRAIGAIALKQYRSDMKQYLLDNEKEAEKGIAQFWESQGIEWKTIEKRIEEDKKINHDAMRQPGTFNTTHDKRLRTRRLYPLYPTVIQECDQQGIIPSSLNLGILDKTGPVAIAYTEQTNYGNYNPGSAKFNPLFFVIFPSILTRHAVAHEFTHITQGHSRMHNSQQYVYEPIKKKEKQLFDAAQQLQNDLDQLIKDIDTRSKTTNVFTQVSLGEKIVKDADTMSENTQKLEKQTVDLEISILIYDEQKTKYLNSQAKKNFVIAIEKGADTIPACSRPDIAAAAIPYKVATMLGIGYPENTNDLLRIDASWKATKTIENTEKFSKQFEHNRRLLIAQQPSCTLL